MNKVKTVSIVSLSRGIIGEPFVRHELDLGLARLREMGLEVRFTPHALMGLDYIEHHPEKRAEDLLAALHDPQTDMILCAIGGDDTYRLLPYLFDNNELTNAVCDKIFLGFSDTTINHLMLHKAGMKTFYGQAFLSDICELGPDIPAYTKSCFTELIETGTIREIKPSDTWYEERTDFDSSQLGVPLKAHRDTGFELLQGRPVFSGKILGGCIDSIFDIFDGSRYSDMPALCAKYRLFPSGEEWRGRILLLETSEERMSPDKYRKALEYLKSAGVFDSVSGILAGKPADRVYENEYKKLLVEVTGNPDLPVLFNINIGHAQPRCIIPFGVEARVDAGKQVISFC